MEVTMGDVVCMILNSGPCPAMVTRVNGDKSLSLTCFTPGEVVFKDNVLEYKFEEGDGDEEKVGYWTTWS